MIDTPVAFLDRQAAAAGVRRSSGHQQLYPENPSDVKYFRWRTLRSSGEICGYFLRKTSREISSEKPSY